MPDHYGSPAERKRVRTGNRTVRFVGEFESSHCVQPHQSYPVSYQRVFSTLRGQDPSVRMGDHPGTHSPEDNGTKVMIGVMMREDYPFYWPAGYRSYQLEELLSLPGTSHGIYYHDSGVCHHEAGVRPAL